MVLHPDKILSFFIVDIRFIPYFYLIPRLIFPYFIFISKPKISFLFYKRVYSVSLFKHSNQQIDHVIYFYASYKLSTDYFKECLRISHDLFQRSLPINIKTYINIIINKSVLTLVIVYIILTFNN